MKSHDVRPHSSWMADFETTTTADDCRVWVWGACSIGNVNIFQYDKTVDSFLEWCWEYDRLVFFHNLAFDSAFFMDAMMKEGYKWVAENPRPGQFTTTISNMGKFYSIEVTWANGVRTEFRDSMKKLPMSVASVAKAFGYDEGKGDIDYHLPRPVGYEPTPEEIDYLRRDVQIVAKALREQIEQGMTRLTVGSDSLAEYREIMTAKLFERFFPVLSDDMDAEIRAAYRGGFTYADSRFSGKRQGAGKVYDVNSLYPYIMYDRLLPYGTPEFFDGKPFSTKERPLWISSITFVAKLKKNHIPCIQVKNNHLYLGTEYQTEISEPTTLYCTNVDWELWSKHYNITVISWNGGWAFTGETGLFNDYIEKWMHVKETTTGGMRQIAKLHLNSLYGKFATNPNVTSKRPVLENGVVKLVLNDPETRNPVYTAMGVFITAYARQLTITAAQENYDTFAYADTDSLHLLTLEKPDNLEVHGSKLGAWACEGAFDEALYMRAKAYCEHMVEDEHGNRVDYYSVHIAGVPDNITRNLTLDDLDLKNPQEGKFFAGKLSPKRVSGGIVLEDVGFTLKY